MQDSLPAGGLRLCRAGVEPAGSLREVSDHLIPLPRAFPGAISVRASRDDPGGQRCRPSVEPAGWWPRHVDLTRLRVGSTACPNAYAGPAPSVMRLSHGPTPSCDDAPAGIPSTPAHRPQPSSQPGPARPRPHRNPVRHAHHRRTPVRDCRAPRSTTLRWGRPAGPTSTARIQTTAGGTTWPAAALYTWALAHAKRQERQPTFDALRAYCARDTLAMVKLRKALAPVTKEDLVVVDRAQGHGRNCQPWNCT